MVSVIHRRGAALVGVTVLVLAGCGTSQRDGGAPASLPSVSTSEIPVPAGNRLVGPGEFADAVADPRRVTINVHVPFEGDIAGTDLSIPFDQIGAQSASLPPERGTPLAVYCRRGPMSATAVATLSQLGYVDVVELQGGMRAWEASGRSLEAR